MLAVSPVSPPPRRVPEPGTDDGAVAEDQGPPGFYGEELSQGLSSTYAVGRSVPSDLAACPLVREGEEETRKAATTKKKS